jgi:ribonuclease D
MSQSSFQFIDTSEQLVELCSLGRSAKTIGFDTEFVSENQYRPELCLLQVAVDDQHFIVDTLAVDELLPFWEMLVSGDHVTIAHAAREEFLFCYRACGRRPQNLFDVQLAAGMVGLDYPASYGNLVSRFLNEKIDKGETRTDWRRRPLSGRQLDYAHSDILHLKPLYQKLAEELQQLSRAEWFQTEIEAWQDDLQLTEDEPQWRRVSGIANLNRRSLGIIRELWLVRDREAERKNRAPRRVIPDDLMVEIAKRGSADMKRLKAIRGIENRVAKTLFSKIIDAVRDANELADNQLPKKLPRNRNLNLGLLGQFLTTALNVVCREQNIAPAIVGTANDVRVMAAWRLGMIDLNQQPDLAQGWRSEMIGTLIDQVLDGTIAIRVDDPRGDQPLRLEYLKGRN